jgi:tRNA (cytidine32/uridine32-2'-O)-methyltransferase
MLSNIRVVLIETTHPGNIGAVARAMKNMCLERLVLVNPLHFPSAEADARASGAQDVLANAKVVETLEAAVADCPLVIGASARRRSESWQVLGPREAAASALSRAESAPVALVFGRESSGLTAQELDRCTHLMHIPANPDYSSLNIAMAVQVLSYELRMLSLEGVAQAPEEGGAAPASVGQMEGLFSHLEQALHDFGFLQAGREGKIMHRLRRLFHRAAPDEREVNILRGILSSAQGRKSMRDVEPTTTRADRESVSRPDANDV